MGCLAQKQLQGGAGKKAGGGLLVVWAELAGGSGGWARGKDGAAVGVCLLVPAAGAGGRLFGKGCVYLSHGGAGCSEGCVSAGARAGH